MTRKSLVAGALGATLIVAAVGGGEAKKAGFTKGSDCFEKSFQR